MHRNIIEIIHLGAFPYLVLIFKLYPRSGKYVCMFEQLSPSHILKHILPARIYNPQSS